ncbi:MAG: PmoA family protein [Verrucomicrobiaceae bacterium]|nr:PmoA family protein [Verrucomicrobiaceae bacterium]
MKLTLLTTAVVFLSLFARAADFTVEETKSGGAVVKVDGQVFAEYVVDQANKPYLWPIYGPTGKSMTRSYPMKNVEGEKQDHPHHRGLNFGHQDIGGSNTWAERASYGEKSKPEAVAALGSIKHTRFGALKGGSTGVIEAYADYVTSAGKKTIAEKRVMTFKVEGDTRVIDVDIDLIASYGEIVVGDEKDSGLSIRVPHSMSVDAKEGGKIINSNGDTDAASWGKRATWCDFHGPVEGEHLGIAMLNHPSSFRHPTPWHARTYGLFTANPFGLSALKVQAESGALTLKPEETIKLRHRFIFHKGDEKAAKIAEAFAAYAKEQK